MKKLNKIAKPFYKKHKKKIFDIIVYGSAVRGKSKPRDIDIIIIFKEADKKEYFDLPYELRKKIEMLDIKPDVKGILLEELFDPKFLARQNLLIEGYSLINDKFLSNRFGFNNLSLFIYSLENLNHNEKTKFQYALKGRGDKKGMIEELKGEAIGIGAVLISIENSEKFKEFFNNWKIKYEEWRGLFVKT
ncbi:MAG: nucleotidyltransferase domain-containing protein [Nanoarchaeota archaeon]|nr:nucleotidyltransferase domain-containing protein [Nanoarchaeota archaeon]